MARLSDRVRSGNIPDLPLGLAVLLMGAAATGTVICPIPLEDHPSQLETYGHIAIGREPAFDDELYVQNALIDLEAVFRRLPPTSDTFAELTLADPVTDPYAAEQSWEVVSTRVVDVEPGEVGRYLEADFDVWA